MQRERGLVLIVGYKLVKGGLWLIIAAVLAVLMRMGLEARLHGVADHLRLHARVWSLKLAELVMRAASPRGLWTLIVALLADGLFSLVEAWALLRGQRWGRWLVVVSTASLLPFEVLALLHHPHVVRAVVLVINVAIVIYLVRNVMRERDMPLRGSGTELAPPA